MVFNLVTETTYFWINSLNATLANNVYIEARYKNTNRLLEQLDLVFLILGKLKIIFFFNRKQYIK